MHFILIYFCTTLVSRILFKDKDRKWEEIENKLQAEHDSLLLKSSNKVIIFPISYLSGLSDEGLKNRQLYLLAAWMAMLAMLVQLMYLNCISD